MPLFPGEPGSTTPNRFRALTRTKPVAELLDKVRDSWREVHVKAKTTSKEVVDSRLPDTLCHPSFQRATRRINRRTLYEVVPAELFERINQHCSIQSVSE